MKTAKELFSKYEILAPSEEDSDVFDQHTDCVDYCGFINAIAEHDKEIISLIDDMIDGITAFDSPRDMWDKGFDNGYKKALTELKEKLK